MFAPTKEAFGYFDKQTFDRLLQPNWYRHSKEFILNFIASPARTRAEWAARAPGEIKMLNGMVYELRKNGPNPRLRSGPGEQAKAYFGDIIALDG